jgi:spore coat polysaccharide biosynthesis predicted glycosyltransferase SpsG
MTHMIVHAEGRADIGYGYLARTGVLAEFALNSGGSVTYVTKTPEPVDKCVRGKSKLYP